MTDKLQISQVDVVDFKYLKLNYFVSDAQLTNVVTADSYSLRQEQRQKRK